VTRALTALVALDPGVDDGVVRAALPKGAGIAIVGPVAGLDRSWDALQHEPADVLVVACADSSDRVADFIARAVQEWPERPVVVLSHGSPNGSLQRLFEAGADDVVLVPESAERVAFAFEKALARKDGAFGAVGRLAKLICVLGPKGGTGKTLTSTNLTVALAASGARVALVDLDLQFGDVGLALGLRPEKTIYDLASSGGSFDAEKLDAYLVSHSSGARVLLAPKRPDEASFITIEFLRDVHAALRSTYEFVVVDTPPGFTPEVIASIDSSSHVCMVGMLDALSLKNTKLGLETLELMGYDQAHTTLVLNRADTQVGISRADVKAVVGRAPDVLVPSSRDIARSINDGVPIVLADEQSEAAAAFRSLRAIYLPSAAESGPADASLRTGARARLESLRSLLSGRT
jgi:pilus assembly protein CpaE